MFTPDLFDFSAYPNHALKAFFEQHRNPLDILNGFSMFLAEIKGQTIHGTVEQGAYIHGDVFIGRGTVIHSGVVIEGPVYIGENVSVRPHSNIRKGAYLCDNVVIGHGADIKNTLALNGAKIQDGTFAGDSLLGFGARVGSGSILSNRKFNQSSIKVQIGKDVLDSGRDFMGAIMGDQSRLGANVTTSPGTVIGAFTWVGSGCVLHGTYGANQLITVKQELEIRAKDPITLKSGSGEYEHI